VETSARTVLASQTSALLGHRFVFVAGLHRSGTTLLARLLAAHPEISGFSGTGAPADEGQHLQSVYPSDHEYGRPGRFGFAPEMHLTESSTLVSEESAQRLFAEWSPHWDLSRPLLLEKSPPNLIKTRFLQALFPDSAFVVVIRHPIPVSIPTAKWRGTRRYDRLFDHWLRCHALFEEDRGQLGRVHVLTYEQLVGNPASVLQDVCEFLEVEPIPPSEAVDTEANEKYFRRWKELKRDPRMRAYLDLVSLKYEHLVRPYGYSLIRPSRSKPLPAWAVLSNPPDPHQRTSSRGPSGLRRRNAAAAALAVAAIALAVFLGSLFLTTHRTVRPTSARSRACERASERAHGESCARH
jgi:Sulfotransferase family